LVTLIVLNKTYSKGVIGEHLCGAFPFQNSLKKEMLYRSRQSGMTGTNHVLVLANEDNLFIKTQIL
jgi:hypothetical protein